MAVNSPFDGSPRGPLAALLAMVLLLFAIGLVVTESSAFAPSLWWGLGVAGMLCVAFGIYLLNQLSGVVFNATDAGLVIHRPGGAIHILYQNICRIDRVKRVSGGERGKVRITFRQAGRPRIVDLSPECPEALVWDILQHCPQLTHNRNLKIVRNRSFRAAEERLSDDADELALSSGNADWY